LADWVCLNEQHLGLAKRLKRLAKDLGDTEKLGDAYEIVGSSHYNLRNFESAMKWHLRSFDICKRIGHLEVPPSLFVQHLLLRGCLLNFSRIVKYSSLVQSRGGFLKLSVRGDSQGQIVAKINYGNALDASGNPEGSLKAYQEAFEYVH
jgi:tetratricopeptide (TPR) repeat protein